MKITTKTTKEQLTKFLGANAKAVKKADKYLFERLEYIGAMWKKDQSKVTRKDLVDSAKEVIALLGDKVTEPALTPVVESSTKKLTKKKAEPKKEEDSSDSEESEKKTAKKTTNKAGVKKKKESVVKSSETSKNSIQLAEMFPETLEVDEKKYELASDIQSIDELLEALENDEEIVFAFYWTERHLRQFDYFNRYLGQPKSFENDLDLATCIWVSDDKVVSYMISMTTEACYMVMPESIPEIDGIRMSNGIEYQIYRAVE